LDGLEGVKSGINDTLHSTISSILLNLTT
jgi:hypothetical protein